GLHTGDARIAQAHQGIVVVEEELSALDRKLHDRALAPDDAAKAEEVQVGTCERREVERAGVVALVLEPVWAREAGAREAELAGALIHHPHEARDAPGRGLSERYGGVVAGHQQQPIEKGLELHL